MTKNEIRILMKNKRELLSEGQRKDYNQKIRDRLFSLDHFKECPALFTYVSFGSEADTIAIIETAFRIGKRVYIPKVEGREMNFYEIHSLNSLTRSKFGILEPAGSDHPYPEYEDLINKKIMLLPGLAFDKAGNRIGYGAGYYDRYLGKYNEKDWLKIGLAYNFQVVENIPADDTDIRADYIITDEALIFCGKHA